VGFAGDHDVHHRDLPEGHQEEYSCSRVITRSLSLGKIDAAAEKKQRRDREEIISVNQRLME
jgi:hypothetical protein